MKKVVLNISESTYEKLRFECILEKKGIHQLIEERIFFKPFCKEVEEAFSIWIEKQIEKIIED